MTSIDAVDYLKGAAILVIVASHYAGSYASGFYQAWLDNYGSLAVSLFFVLAGYLTHYSLKRRLAGQTAAPRALLGYYYGRAARIYPLYWAALLLISFLLPGYAMLHEPNLHILGIYLGAPFIKAPGPYWFVSAIIQCFLLAPFLYLLLKRLRPLKFFLLILLTMPLFLQATRMFNSRSLIASPDFEAFFYRNFFLGNILLFSLGLLIPTVGKRLQQASLSRIAGLAAVAVSAGAFLVLLYSIRTPHLLFNNSWLMLTPLFFLAAFVFCLTMVSFGPALPFRRPLVFCGGYSWSIYLLHRPFFGLLATMGVLHDGSLISLACTLVLLPPFILLCAYIEPRVNTLTDHLGGKLGFGQKGIRERPAES